jgi:ferredoxin--NADP+ reductase
LKTIIGYNAGEHDTTLHRIGEKRVPDTQELTGSGQAALEQYHRLAAVVGAGPAGLFAARELASRGVFTVLFNRDIKPGGLAEYGIYREKSKMKEGLRAQFRQILDTPGILYYGNLRIGRDGDLNLNDLRKLGFQAILVASGAQGTKWLGIPGERLRGVYHAKDLVYHYNWLPPYSKWQFEIGRRVAVVGAGNVMLDITHYLAEDEHVDEIIALARRGPGEVKFEKKELQTVVGYLDLRAMDLEIERVMPLMDALGQDPTELKRMVEGLMPKAPPVKSGTHLQLQFLASPVRIVGDENGRVKALEVEENTLMRGESGEVVAVGTGSRHTVEVDTVIFAIGDAVDRELGLPVNGHEYAKNPSPRFPVEGLSYETYDPQTSGPIEDLFVAGWSRKASTGLVGLARRDGTNGAVAVWQYLQTVPALETIPIARLHQFIAQLGKPAVTQAHLDRLREAEQQRAQELGLEEYKFSSNEEMLKAIGLVPSAP